MLAVGVNLLSSLGRRFSSVTAYTSFRAFMLGILGELYYEQGKHGDARTALEMAITDLKDLESGAEQGLARHVHRGLGQNYRRLAEVLTLLGEDDAAQETSRLARQYARPRGGGPPPDPPPP